MISDNRFLAFAAEMPARHAKKAAPRRAFAQSYVRPLAANQRALVILIENGGIDLDLGGLVDKLVALLPGGTMITADMRASLAKALREKIRSVTDTLIESAELALNRYASAAPLHYDSVAVLRDGTATYEELKTKLIALSKEGKMIDLMILTHGGDDHISAGSGINGQKIKDMKAEHGRALNLRSVYMMNCVGASLNQAWIAAGAKASAGTIRNNYLPEPTTHFFWENWKTGQSFETAVTGAYRKTVKLMNDAVKGAIRTLPIPGSGLLADQINFETMQFVVDSAPMIEGQRSVGIASDDLVFGQSLSSGLATTVLPTSLMRALGDRTLLRENEFSTASYFYESPSRHVTDPGTRWSEQQNPAMIGGIAVGDAIQIGLGAIAVARDAASDVSGGFSLNFTPASRLLVNEARQAMPGVHKAKETYSYRLFHITASPPWPAPDVRAEIVVEWEGNPYGEIGAVLVYRDLKKSTDFIKSECKITIARLEKIPLPGTDPRSWPIVFAYNGSFDPWGNGHWEFSGEFEISAFGALKFNRHTVVSRSAIDATLSGKFVHRGQDISATVPAIPDDQLKYLKSKLP